MLKVILTLCSDESGYVVSAELVLIATITVIAMVVSLSDVSSTVNQEIGNAATSSGVINPSFRYAGLTDTSNQSNGNQFQNSNDFGDSTSTPGANNGFSQGFSSSFASGM